MKLEITNIPDEKYNIISQEVFKILMKNGITEVDPMAIDDNEGNYIGCEYEIQNE